jgi:hypothetical protein
MDGVKSTATGIAQSLNLQRQVERTDALRAFEVHKEPAASHHVWTTPS